MMKSKDFLDWIGCGFATVLTAVQTQQVFQIISLVLTCLATALTIAYTLWKWWKNAKKDGKIDEKEIKEGIDILKDAAKDVKELSNIDKGEDK
jgi:hypothetical protein